MMSYICLLYSSASAKICIQHPCARACKVGLLKASVALPVSGASCTVLQPFHAN